MYSTHASKRWRPRPLAPSPTLRDNGLDFRLATALKFRKVQTAQPYP
jgi:hypothetical protein